MPVALSGVRFVAKVIPHGPAHAVSEELVAAATPFCSMSSGDQAGCGAVSGCPESSFVVSGTGAPFAPAIFGVWQSLHPPKAIKYFPRSAGFSFVRTFFWHPIPITHANTRVIIK